jgi:hypothetical protein
MFQSGRPPIPRSNSPELMRTLIFPRAAALPNCIRNSSRHLSETSLRLLPCSDATMIRRGCPVLDYAVAVSEKHLFSDTVYSAQTSL